MDCMHSKGKTINVKDMVAMLVGLKVDKNEKYVLLKTTNTTACIL